MMIQKLNFYIMFSVTFIEFPTHQGVRMDVIHWNFGVLLDVHQSS